MVVILVVLSVVAGLVGFLLASQATIGAAIVGIGCLLAILARIAQADRQHQQAHPIVVQRPPQPTSSGPFLTDDQIAANRRRETLVMKWAVVGVAVIITGLVVAPQVIDFFGAGRPTDGAVVTASLGDSLSFAVSETPDSWQITNDTTYLLNVCWAERQGQRASVPTMFAAATVTVKSDAFQNADGAHRGPDLQITCSVDGGNATGSIRRK